MVKKYPYVPKVGTRDCGVAALAMILKLWYRAILGTFARSVLDR